MIRFLGVMITMLGIFYGSYLNAANLGLCNRMMNLVFRPALFFGHSRGVLKKVVPIGQGLSSGDIVDRITPDVKSYGYERLVYLVSSTAVVYKIDVKATTTRLMQEAAHRPGAVSEFVEGPSAAATAIDRYRQLLDLAETRQFVIEERDGSLHTVPDEIAGWLIANFRR